MMLGTLVQNKYVKFTIQIVCTMMGLYMLYFQAKYQTFDMGDNPWNARIFCILAFAIIGFGFAYQASTWTKQLMRFAVTFGCLTVGFFMIGGILFTNDMATGTDYTGGNVYIAYDALGTIEDIGKAAIMIANALVIIVPLCILCATVCMIFYADTSDEMQGVVIEGLIAFGFMALYGFLGNYFGWIP